MWRATIRFLFSVQKFDPKKDYYKILSLKQNATSQEIKKSFKTLARKYHPDSATGK
jgi:DnaJ-class molecular chaperone